MGFLALVIAFLLVWLIVNTGSQKDVSLSQPGWHRGDPPEAGAFISRIPGKPATESLSTMWNGERWVHQDGTEVYPQVREWKRFTEGRNA